ncbi:MAG: DUF1624 domain-containing protein [Oscillospiraceae bacterium]|nr:DUF1624 domain-containing protein [Oscillospiraceae bacterium]
MQDKTSSRIQLLDALRGFCIILVVAFHIAYNLVDWDIVPSGLVYNPVLNVLQPFFAGVFIVLAGISSRFSRSNLKRGLQLTACAALVTVASLLVLPAPFLSFKALFGISPTGAEIGALIESGKITLHKNILAQAAAGGMTTPGELGTLALASYQTPYPLLGVPITFGILHLLAVCVLLYTLLHKCKIIIPVSALGAAYLLSNGITQWPDTPSADYFPLVPWFFVFLFGVWLGGSIREGKFPKWFYEVKIPLFPAIGRKTLLIYLLHQPVLYGTLWIFEAVSD